MIYLTAIGSTPGGYTETIHRTTQTHNNRKTHYRHETIHRTTQTHNNRKTHYRHETIHRTSQHIAKWIRRKLGERQDSAVYN